MQTFNIDIAQAPAPLVLYAKQGDSLSRFFQINFLQNGQPWTPPTGATFAVRYGIPGLPSGWYDTIQEQDGSSHSAFGLLGNALTVEIAYEAVSASGRNSLCVLVLDSNGYQLGAWNLALQVEITPGENAPESTQYYSLLSAQVAQVLASVTDAENAATLAQSWSVGGTGTREGEDANNAKYWAGRAAASAGQSLGFRTFSAAVSPDATTGDVDPTSPMLMANLTATSAADRLDHVVVPGKTVQAGSGDPSPANVRALSGVGQKRVQYTFDGSNIEWIANPSWTSANEYGLAFFYVASANLSLLPASPLRYTAPVNDSFPMYNFSGSSADQEGLTVINTFYVAIKASKLTGTDSDDFNNWLKNNPITVDYLAEDGSGDLCTWAAVDGSAHQSAVFSLDSPLFEGDSINNNADTPSGRQCAVYRANGFVTVDGTSTPFTQGTDGYSIALPGSADGPVTACNAFTGLTISGGVCTIPASAFPSSVTSLETANQWAAQNPVQLLYPLATPTTTYSTAQPLKNPEGEWTLSGENTPVGYMRPLTDADRADYAEQAGNADQLAGQSPAWYMPPGLTAPFAGSTAPAGWLLCDGSTVSRATYAALFAVIGTTYGAGDGKSTFALPDLRGNVPAGVTSGHALASKEGERTHRQTVEELAGHSHDAAGWAPKDTSSAQYTGLAAFRGNTWDVVSSISKWSYEGGSGIKFEGGGQPFNIMQPTLYLNYIIKY